MNPSYLGRYHKRRRPWRRKGGGLVRWRRGEREMQGFLLSNWVYKTIFKFSHFSSNWHTLLECQFCKKSSLEEDVLVKYEQNPAWNTSVSELLQLQPKLLSHPWPWAFFIPAVSLAQICHGWATHALPVHMPGMVFPSWINGVCSPDSWGASSSGGLACPHHSPSWVRGFLYVLGQALSYCSS